MRERLELAGLSRTQLLERYHGDVLLYNLAQQWANGPDQTEFDDFLVVSARREIEQIESLLSSGPRSERTQ